MDASTVEYVRLNGTAVRVSSFRLDAAASPVGRPLREATLVVVLPGAAAHRAFVGLLAERPLRLEVPGGPTFDADVVGATHTAIGSGTTSTHRHQLTLRETSESP